MGIASLPSIPSIPSMSALTLEKEMSSIVPNGLDDIPLENKTTPPATNHPEKEIYDNTVTDPVLAKKMALVNDALDEIGMTPFHWKLFFLNGFGLAVESVSTRIPIN